ncbi:hypothetical protein ABQW72_00620 [Xanthomonas hortorum pv. pelargonii]|nr:hypothetical protein [Xanthomonas hortorum]WCI07352.1 hypothetical protein PML25_22400 [Xanthomonas hortorum pv. pelargonii]
MTAPDTHLADDGDAIPRAPRHVDGAPCISMAMLGACPQCHTRQWYLEVTRHPGGESKMYDTLANDEAWEHLFVTSTAVDARPWRIYEVDTADGAVHRHVIGPMPILDITGAINASGVSACGRGTFWRDAASVAIALLPQLEAVERQLANRTGRAQLNLRDESWLLTSQMRAERVRLNDELQSIGFDNALVILVPEVSRDA